MPFADEHKCVILHHDDVIKWKRFPRYWPFVRRIHRSPVNSPHKGQWRGALMFSLICAELSGWVNTREAGDLRRYRTHYDVIVMLPSPTERPKLPHPLWTWWRHAMETFSALLALCAGNSPVAGEFPSQRPVTRSFDFSYICAWSK